MGKALCRNHFDYLRTVAKCQSQVFKVSFFDCHLNETTRRAVMTNHDHGFTHAPVRTDNIYLRARSKVFCSVASLCSTLAAFPDLENVCGD